MPSHPEPISQTRLSRVVNALSDNRRYAFQLGVALVPVAFAFWTLLRLVVAARGVPDLDYWSIFPSILRDDGWNFTLGTLYHKSNEHIVVLAKLFYLLNFKLTGGDNFGLSAIAVCFSLVIATVFACAVARDARTLPQSIAFGVVVAACSFSTMAAHNYLIGMSGVAWIGANLFMVLAVAAVAVAQHRDSFGWYGAGLLLAILATQSYSTGLLAPCAIAVQCLVVPKSRRIGFVLATLGIAYILLIYVLQDVPSAHAERTFHPARLATFGLTFIGGGLTSMKQQALVWGTAGTAVFLVLAWRFARSAHGQLPLGAFWIAVASYALMNSGIAAIGRAGMGGDGAALASRYASIPALFWIGLTGLGLHLASRRTDAWANGSVRGIALLSLVGACTLAISGMARIEPLLVRAQGKDLAALSMWLDVSDSSVMRKHVTSVPGQVYRAIPGLRTIGHVPFDGRFSQCPRPGERLATVRRPAIAGHVDTASRVPNGWYLVRGWALDTGRPEPPAPMRGLRGAYRCVALTDDSGKVVGLALGAQERPDVAKAYNRGRADYGWAGYARAPRDVGTMLHAMVQDEASGRWVALPHALEVR